MSFPYLRTRLYEMISAPSLHQRSSRDRAKGPQESLCRKVKICVPTHLLLQDHDLEPLEVGQLLPPLLLSLSLGVVTLGPFRFDFRLLPLSGQRARADATR